MPRRLPSLPALRAFEAAARLSSFTRAAREIGTTQPGVSRLIRVLEDQVGQILFVRFNRRVELTPAGHSLARSLTESFDAIADAFSEVNRRGNHTLSVVASSGFNPGWLIPIIAAFEKHHSSVSVQLSWSSSFANISDTDYDVALRVGTGSWSGVVSRKICDQVLTPLCSPEFASKYGPLTNVADLLSCPLIERKSAHWRSWFNAANIIENIGIEGPNLSFSTCNLHRDAAIMSRGAALLMPFFYEDEISEGKLLQPFQIYSNLNHNAYWFTFPEVRKKSQLIQKLLDWILDTTRANEHKSGLLTAINVSDQIMRPTQPVPGVRNAQMPL